MLSERQGSYLKSNQHSRNNYLQAVTSLQDDLLKEVQVDCPVFHKFYPGYYIRTMLIPKGTNIIGMMHRKESINIVLDGSIDVVIDGEKRSLNTGERFLSYPGSKKTGYTNEDTLFANVFQTDETDYDKLEKECTYSMEEERILIDREVK